MWCWVECELSDFFVVEFIDLVLIGVEISDWEVDGVFGFCCVCVFCIGGVVGL